MFFLQHDGFRLPPKIVALFFYINSQSVGIEQSAQSIVRFQASGMSSTDLRSFKVVVDPRASCGTNEKQDGEIQNVTDAANAESSIKAVLNLSQCTGDIRIAMTEKADVNPKKLDGAMLFATIGTIVVLAETPNEQIIAISASTNVTISGQGFLSEVCHRASFVFHFIEYVCFFY